MNQPEIIRYPLLDEITKVGWLLPRYEVRVTTEPAPNGNGWFGWSRLVWGRRRAERIVVEAQRERRER